MIPRGAEWGRWHHRLDARAVVSRHLNVPTTRYANDVRFEDASRGYPDEWTVRGKPRERQNCDLEAHFRDILPPTEKDVSEPLKGYEF